MTVIGVDGQLEAAQELRTREQAVALIDSIMIRGLYKREPRRRNGKLLSDICWFVVCVYVCKCICVFVDWNLERLDDAL